MQYQEKRDSLVGSLVQKELDRNQSYFPEANFEKIQHGIQKVRSAATAKEASLKLKDLVERVIRPQSHKLWKQENSRFPNYTSRELLIYALLHKPFNPIPSSLLTAFGVFLFNVFREPFAIALARAISALLILLVFYSVGSMVKVNNLTQGIWLFSVVVVSSSMLLTYVSLVLLGSPFFSVVVINFLVYLSWQLVNTLAVAAIRAIFDSSRTVEEELAKLEQEGALDSSVREIVGRINARELADHLHSTVQNQVLASSLRLDVENPTEEQMSNELDLLEEVIRKATKKNKSQKPTDIEAVLSEIQSRWLGFINIEYSVETEFETKSQKRLQQILEEAVSNAVRHGHAENISLQLSKTGPNCFLSITDDGFGPRGGKAGLGSSLFESASDGKWQLEAIDGGGSRLVVII